MAGKYPYEDEYCTRIVIFRKFFCIHPKLCDSAIHLKKKFISQIVLKIK